VQGFDNHVSAVVPWLRETGISDHIQNLSKDEIRTATAVPPPGDKTKLRVIVDAMESLGLGLGLFFHGSLPPLGLDLLRQVMFYSTAFLYRPSESSTSCLFRSCTNTLGVAYVVVKLVDFWWSQSGMPRASQFEAGNGKRCQERHNSCQKGELCNNCALWATTVQFALISYLEYSRLTSAWHLNVVDRF